MKIIKINFKPLCIECGSNHNLLNTVVKDTSDPLSKWTSTWYCQECLDKLEDDENTKVE